MIRNINELRIERDMIEGNMNRMCVTDDMDELEDMLAVAELRLKRMFYYNKRRIEHEIEQNRCAMACQGCGAVFLLLQK